MEFITSAFLSGVLYDGFKNGIVTDYLRGKLQGWVFDDATLNNLVEKVNALEMQDYGEHVIERKLEESPSLQETLKQIKPEQYTNIGSVTQSHSGSEDNIVGNKTIYQK